MSDAFLDEKQARKAFSRIGLAMTALLLLAPLLQLVIGLLWPEAAESENNLTRWILSFVPMYAVAFPACWLIMHTLPAQKPQQNKLSAGGFLVVLMICFFIMYTGSIIGSLLSGLLSGGNAENKLLDYANDTSPLKILFMVILAPLLEELICRKGIIDHTRQYGEKTAVVLSALCFGLLHQNLFQFFYAFGIGLIFGYVYIRTGKLRITVLLHSIVNFMGSVVAPWILSNANLNAISSMDANAPVEEIMPLFGTIVTVVLYLQILIGFYLAGLVLLIIYCRKLTWVKAENQLPGDKAEKTVYGNAGMVVYILLCVLSIILALF